MKKDFNIPAWIFLLSFTMFILVLLPACQSPKPAKTSGPLFHEIPSTQTGIEFNNDFKEDSIWNFFTYMNIYNGGGIAIGDINNDDLPDLYFTGNRVSNRLYLNKGNLKFEEITQTSGTAGTSNWTTGVTMADVNADGWLDIYVCQAGPYSDSKNLQNLLFINNGDLTFTEKALEFGIADLGRSVHASFFDYDGDLDLDLYVLNHPKNFHAPLEERLSAEQNPNLQESDHLYKNENGRFVLVNQSAGILNWAFGLSVTTSDLNGDGWTDIYVANDYSEPDHYWLNNGDGTFRQRIKQDFYHISNFSMGSDAGDFNNDGWQDLVVVDMMAKDNRGKKTNMSGMDPGAFWDNVGRGRHYQYMQNVLQLNNGKGVFSDVAELAGISNTDWSWSPLLADLDNDGWKDLIITNGMRREVRNNDFSKGLIGLPMQEVISNYAEITSAMPVNKVHNFAFRNRGDLTFADQSKAWGLDHLGFSNGAALADLDQDGDLDLVLNNLGETATVLENRSYANRSLRIIPKGPPANPFGIGLKATLSTSSGIQYQQLTQSRGFQSASEPIIHFGLSDSDQVTGLKLIWPDGKQEYIKNLPQGGKLEIHYKNAKFPASNPDQPKPLLRSSIRASKLVFQHRESAFNDFDREVLLPHIYSQNGPFLASGDVNGDGLEDVFAGGASGQSGVLFLQLPGTQFAPTSNQAWEKHADREDMGSLFFDADGDGDLDLLVISGSNEWDEGSEKYRDRLYLNDGSGHFSDGSNRLPDLRFSGSKASAADFDQDGDLDLFIGGRLVAGKYPFPAKSALLINEKGFFRDKTAEFAPELVQAGMVSDALWADTDGDGDEDLIICGEWMPVRIFENENGKLKDATTKSGLADHVGWWYSLAAADIDQDGDLDLIAGNLGLNNKYKASQKAPFEVYAGDMDGNGISDIVLGFHENGISFPVRGRQCSSQQIPEIKEKFSTYEAFGNASLLEVYGQALEEALHYSATWMQTSYLENQGDGTFKVHPLPNQAQLSPTMGIIIHDIDQDGFLDLILAGNMLNSEVETCRHDASIGAVLKGNGKGDFEAIPVEKSGFFVPGDIKDLKLILDDKGNPVIISGKNNNYLGVFTLE